MRRPLRLSLVLAATVVVAAGCGQPPEASGYDDPLAKEHFLETCTVDTTIDTSDDVDEGTTRESDLAPMETCECVFEVIQEKLPWDELKAFESELDAADEDNLPTTPPALTSAVEQCTTQGPIAPAPDDAGSN